MQLLAPLAVVAFRAITMMVLAMGLAALAALVGVIPLAALTDYPWAARLPRSAALVGLIFVGGSIASLVLMPRRAAVVRRLPPPSDELPVGIRLIAIGWCIAAALQLPSLVAWFNANRTAVEALVGAGPDPLGFKLVPAAIAHALPALTALALLAFVIAAGLVLSSRPELAGRILVSCAAVQGALVAGEYLVRGHTLAVLRGLLTTLQSHGAETAPLFGWLAGNDATARRFEWWLIWMFGGTVAALAISRASAPAAANHEPLTANRDMPKAPVQSPADPRAQPIVAPSTSLSHEPPPTGRQPAIAESPFDQTDYSVKPQFSWNPFARRYSEYDIASIPPMRSARFSFSWTSGRVARVADGAVLFTIAPSEAPGLFFDRTYTVSDAAGVPLGTLGPAGADWTIKFASGDPDVYVLRASGRLGVPFTRFTASRGDRELCRFTWLFQKTVVSAELDIQFLPEADPALRLMAVALAPILELRSRLRSERRHA